MKVLPFYASIAQGSSGLSVTLRYHCHFYPPLDDDDDDAQVSLPYKRGVALLASLVEAFVTVVRNLLLIILLLLLLIIIRSS